MRLRCIPVGWDTYDVDITNSNLFENNKTDKVLQVLRNDNRPNIIFCYLNINSVRINLLSYKPLLMEILTLSQ